MLWQHLNINLQKYVAKHFVKVAKRIFTKIYYACQAL